MGGGARADTRRETEGETLAESSEDRAEPVGLGRPAESRGASRKVLIAVAVVAAAIPTAVSAVVLARSAGARNAAAAEFHASFVKSLATARDSAQTPAKRTQSAHEALIAVRRWKDNDPENASSDEGAADAYVALAKAYLADERWGLVEEAVVRGEEAGLAEEPAKELRVSLEAARSAAQERAKSRVTVLLDSLEAQGPGQGEGRDELARGLGAVVDASTVGLLAERLDRVTAALRAIEGKLYLEAEKPPAGSKRKPATISGLSAALEQISALELGTPLDAEWTGPLQKAAKRLLLREAKEANDVDRPAALKIEQLIARRQRNEVGADLDLVWVVCGALGYSGVHDDVSYAALSRYLCAAADAGVARPAAFALARLDSDPRAQRLLGLALEGYGATSPLVIQLETLTSRTRSQLKLPEPDSAEAHLRRGLLLRARGELGAASGLFKRASELDSKSAEAFGRFAEAQVSLGNVKTAGQAAGKGLKLDPKCAVALLARGLARQREGALEPALQDFEALCEVDVDNPRSLGRRGLARLAFGDDEGAMSDFQRALLFDSGWGQAWLGRGQVMKARGELAAAAADLTQAVELGELAALGARGEVRRGLEDPNGSVADFSRALARSSKDPELWDGRGHSYLSQKNFALAIKDFELAAGLAPREARYQSSLGKAYYTQGDLKKSANYYAQALEKDQQDPKLWEARGKALLSMGRPGVDRAIKDFDRAIELDPKDPELYQNRGLAYLVKGTGIDALEDYKKSIELDPSRAEPYKLRAALWMRERKFQQALDDYGRAIKLAPRDSEALLNQAQAFMALKDAKSAMANFERAIKAKPFDGMPYLRRGQAFQIQARWADSVKDFTKALELDDRIKQAYYWRARSHSELKQMKKAIADLATFIKVTPRHPLLKSARAQLAKLRRG